MDQKEQDHVSAVPLIQIKAGECWSSSLLAHLNSKNQGVCAMRERQPKYVDTITLIALVLMLLSGAMAVQRFLTAEQPGLAPDVQLAVRY
jgi:hypothetical protein